MRATGTRPQRFIAYDRNFQMATLPTTQKGTSKVVAGRGVKINGIYYWSEAFRNPAVERQNVRSDTIRSTPELHTHLPRANGLAVIRNIA